MRFIDANIFLTVLVRPANETEAAKERACRALFDRLLNGEERAQTHATIVAEVAYVLGSRNTYRMSTADIVRRLRPLVELPGLHVPNKRAMLRAFDVWLLFPRLDFEDALTVALTEDDSDKEVYSYDRDFDHVPGIQRVEPER